jgi:hypothetical protein
MLVVRNSAIRPSDLTSLSLDSRCRRSGSVMTVLVVEINLLVVFFR